MPRSGRSQGPNSPLRSTRSMGLTISRSLGGYIPPQDETMPWGPSMPYDNPSKPWCASFLDSSATACFECRTGAW